MPTLRHRYQTYEFDQLDVHVRTLRDRQQFEHSPGDDAIPGLSPANWPLFGVVWDSGLALAHIAHEFDVENLRILEVGCGIGLASLVLSSRNANITATDHHPLAEPFLNYNSDLNGLKRICFVRADWSRNNGSLGQFDLVIGSDLLYETHSDTYLSEFIDSCARPTSQVIIVDPGRELAGKFSARMSRCGFKRVSAASCARLPRNSPVANVMQFSRSRVPGKQGRPRGTGASAQSGA